MVLSGRIRSPRIGRRSTFLAQSRLARGWAMVNDQAVAEAKTIDLAGRLSRSQIFRDYERAFGEATGLPLAFQPVNQKRLAIRGSKWANEFCLRMTETS